MTESIYSDTYFQDTYLKVFRQHYPNLVYFATGLLGDDDAEDVVQEVFSELWKKRDDIEIGENIKAFLYRAVYTRAINVLRRRQLANGYAEAMQELDQLRVRYYNPDDNDVMQRIENTELRTAIHQAINELPTKCREVFRLSYLHDMKNKEIAEKTGINIRTVEAHMYHALKLLRAKLSHLQPQSSNFQ